MYFTLNLYNYLWTGGGLLCASQRSATWDCFGTIFLNPLLSPSRTLGIMLVCGSMMYSLKITYLRKKYYTQWNRTNRRLEVICWFLIIMKSPVCTYRKSNLEAGVGWAWAGQSTATAEPFNTVVCNRPSDGNLGFELPNGSKKTGFMTQDVGIFI